MNLVKLTNFDDWEGFYLDGKLIAENHSVSLETILPSISKGVKSYKVYAAYDMLEELGGCPKTLKEAQKYELELDKEMEF